MYRIDTSDIALGAAMPFKYQVFTHQEAGLVDLMRAVVSGMIGESTLDWVALYGAVNTITGSSNAITSGHIYKSGGVYRCNSATVVLTGTDVVIGTLTSTYPSVGVGDPFTFSDGTTHNVLENQTVVWSAGPSGSGNFDYDDLVRLGTFTEQAYNAANLVAATGSWTVPTTSNFKVSTSPYANTRTININIQSSTISNDTASVTLLIDNVIFKKTFYGTLFYSNTINAVPKGLAYAECIINTNQIRIKLFDNANIKNTGGSPLFDIVGQVTVEV